MIIQKLINMSLIDEKLINKYQFGMKFNFEFNLQRIFISEGIMMNNLYKNKKLQLQSTNYLQNLHFPNHQNRPQQQEYNHSQLSDSQQSQSQHYQDHQNQHEQSQDEQYEDEQSLNENVTVNLPYTSQKLHLISSFLKPTQLNLLKSIDQNKTKYNELLRIKQQNRHKFIQKINKNLTDSQSIFFASNPSAKELKIQNVKKNTKLTNQNQKKIPRSQTEQNKFKKVLTLKDSQSNWDKNSQIDFNLTSQRQGSGQKGQKAQQKSAKKKITIKRKGSINSSVKVRNEEKPDISRQSDETDKKESTLNKSVNEFLFIEQYQKDQKQIMGRLLTIIEQDHINRFGNASIKQSIVRQHDIGVQKMVKMKQNSLNSSVKYQSNQIQTQYSSVKPIVINNYIKSPTQFMGKELIERQMTIRMLEQNRNHKKKSMLVSVADSRILNQSTIVALPLRQHSNEKKSINIEKTIQSKAQKIQKTQKEEIKPKANSNEDKEIDFELLYQKLKKQTEKQKENPKNIHETQTKNQFTSHLTSKQSELMLPINSSRPSQPIEAISSLTNDQKTFTSHNVSQNLTQFNPNSSIQTHQTQPVYNFKKESVSMQISFGNDNEPKQSYSLADAFKKKFGAGKFGPKGKSVLKQSQTIHKPQEALSQLKGFQNTSEGQQKRNENIQSLNFSKKQNLSSKKTVKITKKNTSIRDKQNLNSLQTPRSHSEHYNSTQRSVCTNLSKQPSKQLLDRLIYGHKAIMTKKEMYELSKKNYMKLPEIQQKRKQEQKRLKQLERQQKLKQYQKRIRSSKHSICKDSLKSSLESSFIKQ